MAGSSGTRAALLEMGRLGSGPGRSPWTEASVSALKKALPPSGGAAVDWREQQEAVLAAEAARIRVVALAGTGKTGMLAEYARRRPGKRWRYLVFNRSMAEAARTRLPPSVPCTTFHALAFARFGAPLAAKVDRPWMPEHSTLVQPNIPNEWRWAALALLQATVARFASSADEALQACHVPEEEWRLWCRLDRGGAVWADTAAVAVSSGQLWRAMVNASSPLPCPQEAWVKLAQLNRAAWPGDNWLIDEAQDMSAAMLHWVRQQPGQQICVGDPHQALYGWRTPLAWSEDEGGEGEARFTLSGSHRFGPEIAALANEVLARLGSADRLSGHGSAGRVIWTGRPEPKDVASVAALARTQAGARAAARRAHAAGWPLASLPQIPERWRSVAALLKGEHSAIQDPWVRGFAHFSDLEAALSEEGGDWRRACAWARSGLTDPPLSTSGSGLTVTTLHQAKGREFDTAWLLPDVTCPRGSASEWTPEQAESARGVYVAVTRARQEVCIDPGLADRLRSWLGGAGDASAGPWDEGF